MMREERLAGRRRYFINALSGSLMSAATILTSLVTQRIVFSYFGIEIVGLNSFLTNVVSMLAIAELGIASAMNFQLYRALAEQDTPLIGGLMRLYRRWYVIIAVVVGSAGVALTPFIPMLAGASIVDGYSVRMALLLFVADAAVSYLLVHRRSLLIADRRNWVVNWVHSVALVAMCLAQIIVVSMTQNFYCFLAVRLLVRLLENLYISFLVSRRYPNYISGALSVAPRSVVQELTTRLKGLFVHRIATFVVLGSDSAIISFFLGLGSAGRYANYYMIYQALLSLCSQAYEAVKSGIGRLLIAEQTTAARYQAFSLFHDINLLLAVLVSLGFYAAVDPLVTIWLGSDVLVTHSVRLLMALCLYLATMRLTFHTFKEAAGIFREDAWVAASEMLINIVMALSFVNVLGLLAIPLATTVSNLFVFSTSYYRYVWRDVLGGTPSGYALAVGRALLPEIFGLIVVAAIIRSIPTMPPGIAFLVNIGVVLVTVAPLVLYVGRRLKRNMNVIRDGG